MNTPNPTPTDPRIAQIMVAVMLPPRDDDAVGFNLNDDSSVGSAR